MRKAVWILGLMLTLASPSWAYDEGNLFTGNVNFVLGVKELSKGAWAPINSQGEMGIKMDLKHEDWPISVVIDYYRSEAKTDGSCLSHDRLVLPQVCTVGSPGTTHLEGEITELNLGIRHSFEEIPWGEYLPVQLTHLRPFVGAGFSLLRSTVRGTGLGINESKSENGTGMWGEVGIAYLLSTHFNIGFNVVGSGGLTSSAQDDGGVHLGIFAGYHF